jgi:hypothetical protein
MKKTSPNRSDNAGKFKIGRAGFAKISAVEGMCISAAMKSDFDEFDRKGLSASKRRAALGVKYGKPR